LLRRGRLLMFDAVHFAPIAIEDGTGERVFFTASVDGRPVRCSISAEALERCFCANPAGHEAAFQAHRREIEEAVEAIIRLRGISSGEVRIEPADLGSSIVAFGRSVRSTSATGRQRPLKG
jgi:hypothetical protein